MKKLSAEEKKMADKIRREFKLDKLSDEEVLAQARFIQSGGAGVTIEFDDDNIDEIEEK